MISHSIFLRFNQKEKQVNKRKNEIIQDFVVVSYRTKSLVVNHKRGNKRKGFPFLPYDF